MKIAIVVHDYHQEGGHSRYSAELAERFCQQGHEVHVFANVVRTTRPMTIRFHHVPALRASALTSILTFIPSASLIVGGGFDIVHAQGVCMTHCDVMTAHICNRAWLRARAALGDELTWKDHLFDRVVSPLEHAALNSKRAPWLIAISGRVRDDVAAFYGRRDRTSVIHHGVDITRFSVPEPERKRELRTRLIGDGGATTLFLFVGDLRKGARQAIQSVAQVPEASLVLVSRTGAAPYRQLAQSLGVGARVHLHGPTNRIEDYYAAADGFLFPTPYDAFGMVISEAMASGLPVITAAQAGAAELIHHQESGFLLANAFDSGEAATYVRRVVRDSALGITMGRAARQAMEAQTWNMASQQTMEVYEQVMHEKTNR